jgi:hypothetical protein
MYDQFLMYSGHADELINWRELIELASSRLDCGRPIHGMKRTLAKGERGA